MQELEKFIWISSTITWRIQMLRLAFPPTPQPPPSHTHKHTKQVGLYGKSIEPIQNPWVYVCLRNEVGGCTKWLPASCLNTPFSTKLSLYHHIIITLTKISYIMFQFHRILFSLSCYFSVITDTTGHFDLETFFLAQ